MRNLIYILLISLIAACSKQGTVTSVLQEAERVMHVQPDKALLLLESVQHPEQLSPRNYATWCLLITQARDKNYISQSSGSLINIAIRYFEEAKDSTQLAWAYYYKALNYAKQEDEEAATQAFAKAETIATAHPVENLLGDLYFNWGKYSRFSYKEKKAPFFEKAYNAYQAAKDTMKFGITLYYWGDSYSGSILNNAEYYQKQALEWFKFYKQKAMSQEEVERMERMIRLTELSLLSLDQASYYSFPINTKKLSFDEAYYMINMHDSTYKFIGEMYHDPHARTAMAGLMSRVYRAFQDYTMSHMYEHSYNNYIDSTYQQKKADMITLLINQQKEEQLKRNHIEQLWRVRFQLVVGVTLSLLLLYVGYRYHRRLLVRKEKQLMALEQTKLQHKVSILQKEQEIARLSQQIAADDNQQKQLIAEKESLLQEIEQYSQINRQLEQEIKKVTAQLSRQTSEIGSGETIYRKLQERIHTLPKEDFKGLFAYVNYMEGGFISRLSAAFPRISNTDLEYCSLIRLGFSTKEVATILNVNADSVTTWRRRMRDKINLSNLNVDDFLRAF